MILGDIRFGQNDTFTGFHPVVNLVFFVAVIGFAMFLMHPVSLVVSFVCGAVYAVYLRGVRALRIGLLFLLPLALFTAVLNPLFNHQGVTILAYLPNGNPITAESIAFGFAAAGMLVTVITWFSCFNVVMTSDKFVYLFGRVLPALSLILSMALRLVPRFFAKLRVIANAQAGIGRDVTQGNIFRRARSGILILSIMVTWALENAIDTADSMKARGYGLPGRTTFSIFRFARRDGYALGYIVALVGVVFIGVRGGAYSFRFFPSIRGQWTGAFTIVVFVAQFALCVLPLMLNLKEDLYWKRIESQI